MSKSLALVARAAGPIGREVALGLAGEGYDVVVNFDQDDETAKGVASAVEDAGQRSWLMPGRIGDAMVAKSLVKRVGREVGTLDACVVCPRWAPIAESESGQTEADAFLGLELAAVEPVIQADLKGPLALVQRAGEQMLSSEGCGAIVVVSTGGALRSGYAGAPARAAQAGLAEVVRTAGRALDPDVRVNGVLPGLLTPKALEHTGLETALEAGDPVRAGEVADAAVHLVSAPGGIRGQILHVDAGVGRDALAGRPWTRRDEDNDAGLPGIQRRVQPPEPGDRIDLDDT